MNEASKAIQKALISGASLEATGRDVEAIKQASAFVPSGTKVSVAYLGNETDEQRVAAVRAIHDVGFLPVPHISARRTKSPDALESYLSALAEVGPVERLLVIGGDPSVPEGPYEDALSVIRSGLPKKFGVRDIAIAGYPEGHPDISESDLWSSLQEKVAAIDELGHTGRIATQFSFNPEAVVTWIKQVREREINLPIRVGVPGPAGIKRLMTYATRFGVGTNAFIVKKYGLSLTNLMGTAGPDNFIKELADLVSADEGLGSVDLHFYTFGGIEATAKWANSAQAKLSSGLK